MDSKIHENNQRESELNDKLNALNAEKAEKDKSLNDKEQQIKSLEEKNSENFAELAKVKEKMESEILGRKEIEASLRGQIDVLSSEGEEKVGDLIKKISDQEQQIFHCKNI